ncbi:MAG: RDD family protein [Verrucomicrobiota bacterium]
MDIWIIRDGEKVGPIHDFEVRRKIEDGELPASTPAWHEGLAAWKPLIEIEIFTREFEIAETAREEATVFAENSPLPDSSKPPPLPVTTYYGRRFWARWLDLTLYSGVWWICMWAARQDIEAALLNPWVMFLQYLPWFAIEPLLIHNFGTTPGKWLLNLDVVNLDGSRLDLPAAIRRSLRVMFTGVGFGWPFLALFCQALSIFTAKRLGTTLWDHAGGHRVNAGPLNPVRIVAMVALYVGALLLQIIVVSPYTFELNSKAYPWIKQRYSENPMWHLPKRSQRDPG